MVDENVFLAEMTILKKYFGRQIEDELLFRIYEILKNEISTEQFQYSCQQIFRHERFFPTPQSFLDYALGTLEYQALAAWDNRFAGDLDESAKFALRSIGGKSAVSRSENPDFLEKDFLTAYKAHKTAPPVRPKPALPPSAERVSPKPRTYTAEELMQQEESRRLEQLKTFQAIAKCKQKFVNRD